MEWFFGLLKTLYEEFGAVADGLLEGRSSI
jgi:hypothetical protein